MNHIIYKDQDSYETAILIKETYLDKSKIKQYYLNKIDPDNVIAFGLTHPNKMTITYVRSQLNKLLPALVKLGVKTIYVPDAMYFKALTKQAKADIHIGYVLPCAIKNYEHINVILGISYKQLTYNPNLADKLDLSVDTLVKHLEGNLHQLGQGIIHSAIYNKPEVLSNYLNAEKLAIDIETTGLGLGNRILSIAFAVDKHNGIAFKDPKPSQIKRFFEEYPGLKIFHNAAFDVKHIILNYFMKDANDILGMLHGLKTMCRNLHDTKIIAYLATNNTQGNELGLKALCHEYTGNYGLDVKSLTEATDEVLEYNLKDTLGTHYVYEKYYPIMLQDNQLDIYTNLMMPSIKTIIQMELTGMPVNKQQVSKSRKELEEKQDAYLKIIESHPAITQLTKELQLMKLASLNENLKVKQHGIEKVADYKFNPGSGQHLQHLLYTTLKLPVIDYTAKKQPASGSGTIQKLMNHVTDPQTLDLLSALMGLNQVKKILSTFIPALEGAKPRDNWHYLHGSFNLGGTLSGRLSSSNPNLQNLPSGSIYGKLIKKCFSAPKGWVMVGADFNALEDKINTVLTRDPNKEKVWIDGYDAHCFRAYYYFKDQMPDIVDTVESINSIKKLYPDLRQQSKAPSFALQYGGEYFTLMNNCGFSEPVAKQIEANYHKMYSVSDEWVADKIAIAEKQGYIDTAFGLRIRTPIVGNTILNTSKTPFQATAEARSVGNAVSGQSYGILTNRAVNALMESVWNSEYRQDILPICLIHDAIYLMVRDDVRVIEWVNNHLIKEMQWQELPEIQHDKVKLGAELSIFYPSWANEIVLNNNISQSEIKNAVKSAMSS